MSKFHLNIMLLSILIIKIYAINQSVEKNIIQRINNNNKILRKLEIVDSQNTTYNQIKLSNSLICNIKNCERCGKTNECLNCKVNYTLVDNHCYNTKCQIFGFCNYCDEFDCMECIEGYQLNFGTCDRKVNGYKKKLFFGILIPTLILSIIIYLYIHIKNKNKIIIETGKVINLKHPQPGNYIILPETFREEQNKSDSSSHSSGLTQLNETIENEEIKECIVCRKKKIYAFADCGCGLCKEHWNYIKNTNSEKIVCRKHNTILRNIIFSLDNKTNIKGNAIDKLGLKICPVCKINNGTQSFNCECNMKICQKCFNDNVYILKYNQCPGCGLPYNSKKEKSSGFKFGKKNKG